MGYQKREAQENLIKEAALQSLLNNTAAGVNIFSQRPTPLWEVEMDPGAVCLYFPESKADDRGQDYPRYYIHETFLVAECLTIATALSDSLVANLAQEVKDILWLNRFLVDPITEEKTVAKLKYSHSISALRQAGASQTLISLSLYFRVWYEEKIPPHEPGTILPLQRIGAKFNTDKPADGHAGPEVESITTIPQ